MKKIFKIRLILFIILLAISSSYPQQNNLTTKFNEKTKNQTISSSHIFNSIEQGIGKGEVSLLSAYFNNQTYFSLSNGINGYYSSNQAFYLLEDFFKLFKVISFRFNNIKEHKSNPYATGLYFYEYKGKRASAQVYVSLTRVGNNWKITQITIN
jgi:hypothetical protein